MKSSANVKQVLKQCSSIEIELLLAHVLKKSKEFIFLHPEYKLTKIQVYKLTSMIRRRQKGEPIAYILGYKDFYSLRFKVNRDVLIPRPETEALVDFVIASATEAISSRKGLPRPSDALRARNDSIKILDVGTGSGGIVISIAKQLKNFQFPISNFQFCASDISSDALKVAKANTKTHHAKIKFIKSDLFQNIKGRFDIIVANLPYVPEKNYELRIKNLEWEPKIALVDVVKDFDIYRRFFEAVSKHLNPESLIYLEIDPKLKPYIIKYVKQYLPKLKLEFYKDLSRLWRFVEIKNY